MPENKVITDTIWIEELLTRGVEAIFPNKQALANVLQSGKRLRIYVGVDPTGPTLHIGHAIPLSKLGQFQKGGHQIIFLVGDFTAMIGDPTDKTAARKKLTKEEVQLNLTHYIDQARNFLSFEGENKAEVRYNSEWLAKMNFSEVLELCSLMTVDQMLKRDMFAKRVEENKPIFIHEFMYPLMQGYDSVALDVDLEIGGNDQTFNMLAGRDLSRSITGKEKFVLTTKLLVDGQGKKMGKTEGNAVSLHMTAEEMFGRVMSWADSLIIPGFELCTDVALAEIASHQQQLAAGSNPRDSKLALARAIVTKFKGSGEGERAEKVYIATFSEKGFPEIIQTVSRTEEKLSEILIREGLIDSKSEFKRLVDEGAITHEDGQVVSSLGEVPCLGAYRIGKKRFIKFK